MENLENEVEQEQQPEEDLSLWQEVTYFLKLMRSVFVYHYRYDEVFEDPSWRDIFLMAGIASVIKAIFDPIVGISFRLYFGSLGASGSTGFDGMVDMLSTMNPVLKLLEIIWLFLTIFIIICGTGLLIGYCLQLWFGKAVSFDQNEWLSFAFAVTLVASFQRIFIDTLVEISSWLLIISDLRLSSISANLLIVSSVIAFLLIIYSYWKSVV